MITPLDIVTHLRTYVPAFTDKFTNAITPTSVTVSGTTVTVNATAHGLTVGNRVLTLGGTFRNPTTGGTLDTGTGRTRFSTQFEHDFTFPKGFAQTKTLTLEGFTPAAWNGTHTIRAIPSRQTFEIDTPTGETLPPTVQGVVLEPRTAGLGGVQTVATVPTPNSFTIDMSGVPALPVGAVDGLTFVSGWNIRGASDIERAEEIYTKQSNAKPYMFVVMTGTDASKDRKSHNDAIAAFTAQDINKQTLLQNFTVIVIIPTADETSGARAQNIAHTEIFNALLRALYGLQLTDNETSINYRTVSQGHGPAGNYNTGYYIHTYDWQVPFVITYDNGFDQQAVDVAFRDIIGSWNVNIEQVGELTGGEDETTISVNIDLDEAPGAT